MSHDQSHEGAFALCVACAEFSPLRCGNSAQSPRMAQADATPEINMATGILKWAVVAIVVANEVCASATGSEPGRHASLVLVGSTAIWLLPGSETTKMKCFVVCWSICLVVFPLLFIVDDLRRTEDEVAERLSHVPTISPMIAFIWGSAGYVHGALPFGPRWRIPLLCAVQLLTTLRCLNLCVITRQFWLPVLAASLACLPCTVGFWLCTR